MEVFIHDFFHSKKYITEWLCIYKYTYFSIGGTESGCFPLAILGVCLAGTLAILDQDTADDSKSKDLQGVNKSKDLQGVNKKIKSMKDAVGAVTAGISTLDVGLTS